MIPFYVELESKIYQYHVTLIILLINILKLKLEFDFYYWSFGQDHVFTFWDELSSDEQRHLLADLQTTDIEEMNELFTRAHDKSSHLNTQVKCYCRKLITPAHKHKGQPTKKLKIFDIH